MGWQFGAARRTLPPMIAKHPLLVAALTLAMAPAAARAEATDPADFARLLEAIKPQPGESPWREIGWLTDVTAARVKAVAEDKPLVIFTAADGSPLGRT